MWCATSNYGNYAKSMNKPLTELRRILLVRTDRIGDVLLTTPAATVLKELLPDVRIYFLTREYTAKLLYHHKHIDNIFIYDPLHKHRGWQGVLRLASELKEHHLDAAVLFFPTFPLALTLSLAAIPLRAGMGFRWYSFLLNRRHFEHRKFGLKHESQYNLSLLTALFPKLDAENLKIRFEFELRSDLLACREQMLKELGLGDGYVVLHPGSGGSAPNLSPGQYTLLLRFLLDETPWKVVLTGTAAETPLIRTIARTLPGRRIVDASGKLDLEELMGLISSAKLFISGSTGPLHIANALQIPVLAFYCPSVPCSPTRWGPYHQQRWAITPDVIPCKSCNPATCPNGNCLTKLTDSLLLDALRKRLEDILK